MTKFTYSDIVRILPNAKGVLRPGEKAWIVGVFEDRPLGKYFETFPPGVVYTIEFEDGSSAEVHETMLEFFPDQDM